MIISKTKKLKPHDYQQNRAYVLLVMVFFTFFSFSQSFSEISKIDSLKIKLKGVRGPEKGELFKLIIREILITKSSDSALFYIEEAKQFNFNNEYYNNYLKILEYECQYYSFIGNYKKVIEVANNGIEFSISLSAYSTTAKFYNLLSIPYSIIGDYTGQMNSSKLALEYAEKSNDTLQQIVGHGYLATFYWHIGDLEGAIKETNTAIEIAKKYPKFEKKSTLLANLANFYMANEKYTEALLENNKGLKIAENVEDSALIYQNTGIIYYLVDSFKLSKEYLFKSFKFYGNSILTTKKLNHYFYLGMIELKSSNYKKANTLLEIAYSYAKNSYSIETLESIYFAKYQIAEHFGRSKKALEYLKQYHVYKDSIFKENNLSELKENEWRGKLALEKQEKEYLLEQDQLLKGRIVAEKKAKQWSTTAFIVSLGIIALLILVVFLRRRVSKTKKILRETIHNNEMELKNKELITLKLQRINRSKNIEEFNLNLSDLKSKLEDDLVSSDDVKHNLSSISRGLEYNTEKDWEDFKIHFENLHENFYKKLKEKYPRVTPNDEKIIAYLKVNMDTKQIARILHVTPQTVRTQKYRLRKKMNLPPNSDIKDYLDF